MNQRPLSPHLQIYRWRLTMAMSILHRATGVALAIGTLVPVAILVSAAMGPDAFDCVMRCVTSVPGQVLLFGWTVALFYHMFNGIRHLFWDMGKGYDIPTAFASGYAVLTVTAVLVLVVWWPRIQALL